MTKKRGFCELLFIADDTILLNNLLHHMFLDNGISVIFVPTWDEGIKYIEKDEFKLIIIDSILLSKLDTSSVLSSITKTKTYIFFINVMPNTWVYKIRDKIKNTSIHIYKSPLIVDDFLKIVHKILKDKSLDYLI